MWWCILLRTFSVLLVLLLLPLSVFGTVLPVPNCSGNATIFVNSDNHDITSNSCSIDGPYLDCECGDGEIELYESRDTEHYLVVSYDEILEDNTTEPRLTHLPNITISPRDYNEILDESVVRYVLSFMVFVLILLMIGVGAGLIHSLKKGDD